MPLSIYKHIARITKLSRPTFSKTLVLVKSRVKKYRPGLNINITFYDSSFNVQL